MKTIQFRKLCPNAILPTRGSESAAGLDLYCSFQTPTILTHGSFLTIPTGIAVFIEPGFYGRIEGPSGLAARHGIDAIGGIINSDYRGELHVILANTSKLDFTIHPGTRIAQLIVSPVVLPAPVWADTLPDSKRGENGFGSTGA